MHDHGLQCSDKANQGDNKTRSVQTISGLFSRRRQEKETMLALLSIICFCSMIGQSLETTTKTPTTHTHGHHHTRTTHEAFETESFSFYYDYISHVMAVKSSLHICYLYKTSAQEQIDVHTSHGLHGIEKTLIDLIDAGSAMHPIPKEDVAAMSRQLAHFCSHTGVFMQMN